MSNIYKFYNLNERDTNDILRKISEMAERERQIYGVKDLDDYILSMGLDVYNCMKNHCLKKHIFDNPPIYESGIICSPYIHDDLEFEVLTPDVFSPWTVVLRKKTEPFTLYRKTLRNSTYDLLNNVLEYASNDIATTKTLYNKMYKLEQKHIENVIFNYPATIVFWNDRTKTVVKVADGETFDSGKGLAMAITKKYFGNDSSYYKVFKKWLAKDKTVDNKIPEYKRNRHIKNVIFNDPATIVFWNDGTKTVVKAQNEKFDPEKGLAMAIAKKSLGNKGNYYNEFKKWLTVKKVCSSCKYFTLDSSALAICQECLKDETLPNWEKKDTLPEEEKFTLPNSDSEKTEYKLCAKCKYAEVSLFQNPCLYCYGHGKIKWEKADD